ncbi:MAG: hypothetical protein AB7F89_08775 [Pirellulaceae bacterium]
MKSWAAPLFFVAVSLVPPVATRLVAAADAPLAVSQLVDQIQSADDAVRDKAVSGFKELGPNADAARAIEQIVNDSTKSSAARLSAINAYCFVSSQAAAIQLLGPLVVDQTQPADFRGIAIRILAGFREKDGLHLEPTVVPLLLQLFTNKAEDLETRKFAGMMAFGASNSDRVAKAYAAVWTDSTEVMEMRVGAVFFSGSIWSRLQNEDNLIVPLLDLLENQKEPHQLRTAAGYSIASYALSRKADQPPDEKHKAARRQVTRRLMAVFANPGQSDETRASVGAALVRFGGCNKQDVPTFITVLSSNDQLLFSFAATSLGQIGADAKPATSALIRAFSNCSNEELRYDIAQSLNKIDPDAAKAAGIIPVDPKQKTALSLPSSAMRNGASEANTIGEIIQRRKVELFEGALGAEQ